jgi:hypothetical protein
MREAVSRPLDSLIIGIRLLDQVQRVFGLVGGHVRQKTSGEESEGFLLFFLPLLGPDRHRQRRVWLDLEGVIETDLLAVKVSPQCDGFHF